MEQGPSGLNPELRTPPLPATHVRAGTGHRVLARNYTTDKVGPPTCEFTRDVRPRVATSSGSSPPPTWPNSWTDSTDTNKPRHPRAPNPRPPDPRWTYKPDHSVPGRPSTLRTSRGEPHGPAAAVDRVRDGVGVRSSIGDRSAIPTERRGSVCLTLYLADR